MKELSLNILDIAENSLKACASLTEIRLDETEETLTITISDNGNGMSQEVLKSVRDPFYTTRTTRKVGMGIPLFKMAAEQTGGKLNISSKYIGDYPDSHGTVVTASFNKKHIDYTPLGDVISTVITLIQGHPSSDFLFEHSRPEGKVNLDTRQLREVLGEVPLNTFEVISWIKEYLLEQYSKKQSEE